MPLYTCMLSSILLFVTLWTVAYQTLLSMKFSRQEYWSRSCPPPGDLPDLIEPTSLRSPTFAAGSLPSLNCYKFSALSSNVDNKIHCDKSCKTFTFNRILVSEMNINVLSANIWLVTSAVYWIGPKLHSSFSVTSYRKIQSFLANPIY